MKKIIITAAVAAFAASVVSAQVSSANIVGYNKNLTADGLVMLAQQFNDADATPEGLFGSTLPIGSTIYKFDPLSGYDSSTYSTVFLAGDQWSSALDLSEGSFWVETTVANEAIFSGEVEMADSVTNSIVPGLQMIAYPWPVEVAISDLNITPTLGDTIFKYDPVSGYDSSTYSTVFLAGDQWSSDLVFSVGEGFWYQSADGATKLWIEVKPF